MPHRNLFTIKPFLSISPFPRQSNTLLQTYVVVLYSLFFFFFFQAEDGIRDSSVTGVQTCALPISVACCAGSRRGCSPGTGTSCRSGTGGTCTRSERGSREMPDEKPLSAAETVKEESHGLAGDLAAQLAAGTDGFSEAGAQLLKFHGTYQQEDRDQRRERRGTDAEPARQFMVRCKIPGGVLSGAQYLAIDELADRYGNGTLRVTTRQGNQLHV